MSKNEFICDCNIIHRDAVENTVKNMPDGYTFTRLAEFFKITNSLSLPVVGLFIYVFLIHFW